MIKALDKADATVLKAVRGYERKFASRRVVLEEADRVHRERAPRAARLARPGLAG